MKWFKKSKPLAARAEQRHATLSNVELLRDSGEMIAEAMLRDISRTGALLHSNIVDVLPSHLHVRLPLLGTTIGATVRWRKDGKIGLQFDREVDLDPILNRKRSRADTIAQHFARNGLSSQ